MDVRMVSGEYRSLTNLQWSNIPNLAVLTGENGSGKTHVLELIGRAAGLPILPDQPNKTGDEELPALKAKVEITPPPDVGTVVFVRSEWWTPHFSSSYSRLKAQADAIANARTPSKRSTDWDAVWEVMESAAGKPRDKFSRRDVDQYLPPNFPLLSSRGLPVDAIPAVFLSYEARIARLREDEHLTYSEAEKRLDPLPWDILNNVLATAKIPYTVDRPVLSESLLFALTDQVYSLKLHHTERVLGPITPWQLSSGERVMFQVALWLFAFAERRRSGSLDSAGRLLLLDEPDAHLHPTMTHAFLTAIRTELVEKHGIRVIMTTHSPSTVALSDSEEIFVKEPYSGAITNMRKWDAVGKLTAGYVHTGTESKCVFVEALDDKTFFLAVQDVITEAQSGFDRERPLMFVPAYNPDQPQHATKGGKGQVKRWVRDIPSTQIAGIIDFDHGNAPDDRLYVLARYSLESYLLDPLFLLAVLLEEGKWKDPGLTWRNAVSLLACDPGRLQEAVDRILDKMRLLHPDNPSRGARVSVEYFNGPTLELDKWILYTPAKPMLPNVIAEFGLRMGPELITKYRAKSIIPNDLVRLLITIQTA